MGLSVGSIILLLCIYTIHKRNRNKETEPRNEADSRVPHVIPYHQNRNQNSRTIQTGNQIDNQYSVHFQNKNIHNDDLPSYNDLFKNNRGNRNSLSTIIV